MNKLFLLLVVYVVSIQSAATITTSTSTIKSARLSHLQPGAFNKEKATLKDLCCRKIAQSLCDEIVREIELGVASSKFPIFERLPHELREAVLVDAVIQEFLRNRSFKTRTNREEFVICKSAIRCTATEVGKERILQRLLDISRSELNIDKNAVTFYTVIEEVATSIADKTPPHTFGNCKCKNFGDYTCKDCAKPITLMGVACDRLCPTALKIAPLYNQWEDPSELLKRTIRHGNYSLIKDLPIGGMTVQSKALLLDAAESGDLAAVEALVNPHPNRQEICNYLLNYALAQRNIGLLAKMCGADNLDTRKIIEIVGNHPNRKHIYALLFSDALANHDLKVIEWMLENKFFYTERVGGCPDLFRIFFISDRQQDKKLIAGSSEMINKVIYYALEHILSIISDLGLSDSELHELKNNLRDLQEQADFTQYSSLEAKVLIVREYIRNWRPLLNLCYGAGTNNATSWIRIRRSKILDYIFKKDLEIYKQNANR